MRREVRRCRGVVRQWIAGSFGDVVYRKGNSMALPKVSLSGDPFTRAKVGGLDALKRYSASGGAASIKLATEERIVNPGEDILAFTTSRQLRSEISSLTAVASSSQSSATALGVGIDGLSTMKDQLDSIKTALLQAQSADVDMRAQIQAEIDASLALIDSTAESTRFGGRSLLNGDTGFKVYDTIAASGAITNFAFNQTAESLTQTPDIQNVRLNKIGAGLPTRTLNDGRKVLSLTVSIASTSKATKGSLTYTAGAAGGFAEFRVTGKLGSVTLRIESTAASLGHITSVATAFNSQAAETGVALSSDGAGLKLTAVGFGDDDFVKVELLSASSANTAAFGGVSSAEAVGTSQTAISKSAVATVNGTDVRLSGEYGNVAHFSSSGYDMEIQFGTGGLSNGQAAITTQLNVVLDQGITGILGTGGSSAEKITFGFGRFTTRDLGRFGNGVWAMTEGSSGDAGSNTMALGNLILSASSMSELSSGGRNDISSGNLTAAIDSIDRAIDQIITEQTKLGAIQNTFNAAVARAQTQIRNLSAADSDVIGVNAAEEINNLLQSQLGVQSATAVLSQTVSIESSIYSLIR